MIWFCFHLAFEGGGGYFPCEGYCVGISYRTKWILNDVVRFYEAVCVYVVLDDLRKWHVFLRYPLIPRVLRMGVERPVMRCRTRPPPELNKPPAESIKERGLCVMYAASTTTFG